jgi:hypothetical protein
VILAEYQRLGNKLIAHQKRSAVVSENPSRCGTNLERKTLA